MKALRAIDIARLLGGEVEGDGEVLVSKPAPIEQGEPGAISFLGNLKYEAYAYACRSSVLLVARDFYPKQPLAATLIRVDDVYQSVGLLLKYIEQQQAQAEQSQPAEISPQAFVHPTARIAPGVRIDAFAYVGAEVELGEGCVLYPHVFLDAGVRVGAATRLYSGVKVYRDCLIGSRCIVHANAVIGSDGFGFVPQPDGSYQKIPQLGIVQIEDDVEIGANTTIDRATMDKTRIGKGVKLDNLIQIGHNVHIDEHTVVAAQAGIAGSTKIGKYCMIGGQAGFVGHIQIAEGTKVQAQSGVSKSVVRPHTALQGSPALPYADSLRVYAVMKNLPQLQRRLDDLERHFKEKDQRR